MPGFGKDTSEHGCPIERLFAQAESLLGNIPVRIIADRGNQEYPVG
jgi:hypothetical protein